VADTPDRAEGAQVRCKLFLRLIFFVFATNGRYMLSPNMLLNCAEQIYATKVASEDAFGFFSANKRL
jgi:hypothetical protein